jgi:hypothetical protein
MSDDAPISQVSPRNAAGGLMLARVLDLAAYHRLIEGTPKVGLTTIGKLLGINTCIASALRHKKHWQQNALKVRMFNALNQTTIDEETGEANAADLKKFGLTARERKANAKKVKQGGASMATDKTDPETKLVEAAGRLALAKHSKPPVRLDSAYFQQTLDETIWRILRELDDIKIGGMTGQQLASAASTLLEKRALLRGEPTQIVRNENRGSLEKVGELLLAELARRGRKIPGAERLIAGAKT